MSDFDVIIIGSGINSLVCGAELTAKGRRVLILERASIAGGCIRTGEITQPGFRHDLFSTSYPLFVTSSFFPKLKPILEKRGVRFVLPPLPTGVLLPDGRWTAMGASREETINSLNAIASGDGEGYRALIADVEKHSKFIFGLLGQEPRSFTTMAMAGRELLHEGLDEFAMFASDALMPMRAWLETTFSSDLSRALIAPWVLHAGLSPDSTASALIGKVIFFALDTAGNPFVEGGSDQIVQAFIKFIEGGGGAVVTDSEVIKINVEEGASRAVTTASGKSYMASRAIVCNVTPLQLYGKLLSGDPVPDETAARARTYRFGRPCMQIHLALSEPPRWPAQELANVGFLHLTPGLDGVSRAVNEADRGLLPTEATIVVGQPIAADPTRCPRGASILWLQLQELPRQIRGDAAGEITTPVDGRWNDEVSGAYADRIIGRLRSQIANFDAALLSRNVLGPHKLEESNMNLVGGDPYSGSCTLDQYYIFRPFAGAHNHKTPFKNLYHIGASTHPGPGLGGVSGHLVAEEIG